MVNVPLVIHGTSGIKESDLIKLKRTAVAKFNVGTSLRQALGYKLREVMSAEPEQYDRQYLLAKTAPAIEQEAKRILTLLAE